MKSDLIYFDLRNLGEQRAINKIMPRKKALKLVIKAINTHNEITVWANNNPITGFLNE